MKQHPSRAAEWNDGWARFECAFVPARISTANQEGIMMISSEGSGCEVQMVELQGTTRKNWQQLARRKQDAVLDLPFVRRWSGARIFFQGSYTQGEIAAGLTDFLTRQVGSAIFSFVVSEALNLTRNVERLQALIRQPRSFDKISFGADVAEHDTALLNYFVHTRAFERADNGQSSVIVGPKGSGKTSILKALQGKRGTRNTIVITPEVFATSMLRQVIEGNKGMWDEDQAFVSTWIFTILIEVFRRLSEDPRGVPTNTIKRLRGFLRDNVVDNELDLFSRFIGYLKRIEGIKVGHYELAVKTRKLQELYSLESLYAIVPCLRGAGDEILILLDELDTGWDNTAHANQFVGSLLQAAIKIQGLGLKARVIAFLRSEIFDLVKEQLDHLDKLRTSMDVLKWSDGELADMLSRRISHSLGFTDNVRGHELAVIEALFEGSFKGLSGFGYLVSRTTSRPREILQFASHAHELAVHANTTAITPEILFKAEEDFSPWKNDYVCAEFRHIYPGLKSLIWLFRAKGPVVSGGDALEIAEAFKSDSPVAWSKAPAPELLQILYSIEFLGVPRPSPAKGRSGISAQYEFAYERPAANVKMAHSFLVHPAFWSFLEIESV